MPIFFTADFCLDHINRVNRELGTLRLDYTTIRQCFVFWQPQLDNMAKWFRELRKMHQGIAHRLEKLRECPRDIDSIKSILQQLSTE